MKRGFIIGVSVAAVALGLILIAKNRCATTSGTPAAIAAAAPATPQLAPDFTLVDLDGKIVRLSDLRGQPVVVNFWATWCPPCRAEIPTFIDLQKKYGAQGLHIVGIAMDDSGRDAVARFARQNGINYTVAMPTPEVVQHYGGVDTLPTTFYIGRDGRVIQTVTGLISSDAIEQNIQASFQNGSRS